MESLAPARRRALRAKAHHLDPVVTIGHHGLTKAVLHEIDVALTAHELVKVRMLGDDRDARQASIERICAELDCAPVQQIGKLLVLWRPKPPEDARTPTRPERAAVSRRRSSAKSGEGRAPAASPQAAAPRPRPPAGKAPKGVPRAALPRRRRGA